MVEPSRIKSVIVQFYNEAVDKQPPSRIKAAVVQFRSMIVEKASLSDAIGTIDAGFQITNAVLSDKSGTYEDIALTFQNGVWTSDDVNQPYDADPDDYEVTFTIDGTINGYAFSTTVTAQTGYLLVV